MEIGGPNSLFIGLKYTSRSWQAVFAHPSEPKPVNDYKIYTVLENLANFAKIIYNLPKNH